ncbi:membrane dipeptidase [Singulisphaera rosea]
MEEAYRRGIRVIGLVHDNDATPPLGDLFTAPPRHGGLTGLGADVIKECNRLGILVDMNHGNVQTVEGALKLSTKPVIFSHTTLSAPREDSAGKGQMMQSRNIPVSPSLSGHRLVEYSRVYALAEPRGNFLTLPA